MPLGASDAPRLRWLRPGAELRVLGVMVGYEVDHRARWRALGTAMLAVLRSWTRRGVKLSLRARVLVAKTMASSKIWFAGAYTPVPRALVTLLTRAVQFFVHRGTLPAGLTVDSSVGALTVPGVFRAESVAWPASHGGLNLWGIQDQLDALSSKWV